jgi:hypothetical protein
VSRLHGKSVSAGSRSITEIENALKSTGKKIRDNRGGSFLKRPRIAVAGALAALGCGG